MPVTKATAVQRTATRETSANAGGVSPNSKTAATVDGNLVSPARKILAIDIGGTKVKMLINGAAEARKVPSGIELTPPKLVAAVKETTADWQYDSISIGYPGL